MQTFCSNVYRTSSVTALLMVCEIATPPLGSNCTQTAHVLHTLTVSRNELNRESGKGHQLHASEWTPNPFIVQTTHTPLAPLLGPSWKCGRLFFCSGPDKYIALHYALMQEHTAKFLFFRGTHEMHFSIFSLHWYQSYDVSTKRKYFYSRLFDQVW